MQTSVQTIFGRNFCRGCNRIGRHFQGKHFSKWNRRLLQTPYLPISPMHQFLAIIGMFDTQPMQYCTKSMINLYIFSDLNAVRRLMSNDSTPLLSHRNSASGASRDSSTSRKFGEISNTCPSCRMPFDKAKKRRLVDTCGHERCYACMFRNETCPICVASGKYALLFFFFLNGRIMTKQRHDTFENITITYYVVVELKSYVSHLKGLLRVTKG